MQKDLNAFLRGYDHERTHQGRNINGRTPYQAFIDGLPKNDKPGKKEKLAAA